MLIKLPLRLDKFNECILEADGRVFMRYTWGVTPLDFLRKQEAKAMELVETMNSKESDAAPVVASRDWAWKRHLEKVANGKEETKR